MNVSYLRRLCVRLWPAICGLAFVGCLGAERIQQPEVVVYTALDREFSEPIFERFTESTGIRVRAKYDTEANKTVGLTHLIMNQASRPRCDVFWNNEIINTLRLQESGLLAAYDSPQSAAYPAEYQSPTDHWYGFAARARILLVNTQRVSADDLPTSINDLVDVKWQDQIGIAKPLFGTTASHAACLFATWGEAEARDFFEKLHRLAKVLPGNRQVAEAVGSGQLAFGLTDTDDAMIEIQRGRPVQIVYPDQEAGGLGTLFIPNTLALIEGGPNPDSAKKLLDFLLSAETEQTLARGESAQIPLQAGLAESSRVATPDTILAMKVDFERAAADWQRTAKCLRDIFVGPK